jgi:glycosyltransferase involved in cell wall biosynthesis
MADYELCVVVPVYSCERCLRSLHERLVVVLEELVESFEIVFVDDFGPDNSWQVLRELADSDTRVRAIRLSRNFGQQAAITAGLAATQAAWTVVMDCDLQDPPEVIPRLWAKAQEGSDVVFGRRVARTHSAFRRFAAKAYFRFLQTFLGVKISGEFGAFTLISRRAREAVLAMPDADRHYVPMLLWVGYEQSAVDYELGPRFAGKSSYSLGALVRLAVAGVLFQTTSLLRWIIYAGLAMALAGFAVAAFLIISYFLIKPYPGWTSLVVVILVTSGFLALSTGVTGLYVGSVFRQVKGRPLYVIDIDYRARAVADPRTGRIEREVQS